MATKINKPEILAEYFEICQLERTQKARKEELKNLIFGLMSEQNTLIAGNFVAVKSSSVRSTLDTTKLKSENPDIYNSFLKETIAVSLKVTEK